MRPEVTPDQSNPSADARHWYLTAPALVFFLLAAFGQFWLYTNFRAMGTEIGFDFSRSVELGLIVGLVMASFFIPVWLCIISAGLFIAAAAKPDDQREFRDQGSCPACGYSTAGLTEPRCPECGGDTRSEVRPPPVLTARNSRRYAALLVAALALAVVTSEVQIAFDTAAFIAEAKACGKPLYSRGRWWPSKDCAFVTDGTRVWATD